MLFSKEFHARRCRMTEAPLASFGAKACGPQYLDLDFYFSYVLVLFSLLLLSIVTLARSLGREWGLISCAS